MAAMTVIQKILAAHLLEGELVAGSEIKIRIDQTLCQDATGTMAFLELEAMGVDRVRTDLSVQYIDHNTNLGAAVNVRNQFALGFETNEATDGHVLANLTNQGRTG